MSQLSNFARVECPTGALVVPAHSPYDREVLREHISILIRRGGTLKLGLDGQQWTVTELGEALSHCADCAEPIELLRFWREGDVAATCIDCAVCQRAAAQS